MKKQVSGYCPAIGRETTISVDYIYSSALLEGELWVKGLISDCPAKRGIPCGLDSCPIADLLPENIPF